MRASQGHWLARITVSALLLAVLAGGLPVRAETLNVVSWDGVYVRSQVLGFIRNFEETTGHRVNIIQYTGEIDEIRRQVRSWNVSWDIVDMEGYKAIRACSEGLLEPLDPNALAPAPDGTPAIDDYIELDPRSCGAGNVVSATVLSFRRGTFEQPPTRLEDFFDLTRYPGRRGLRKSPKGTLEWALIADGVDPDKVYEVLSTEGGLDRAFRRLDELKPHVDWWERGEDAIQMLETRRVVMAAAFNGRVAAAQERGSPLEMIWDHQIWAKSVWAIPRNGRNTDLAREFLRFATTTESLAGQARYITYGPMRRSSLARLGPERLAQLPTAAANLASAVELDAHWWSANLDRISSRFHRWLERPVRVPRDLPR